MTVKTEFKVVLLESKLFDIFGASQTDKDGKTIKVLKGLLSENLNQGIKQHLKRLGVKLSEEDKLFKETIKELRNEFYDEVDGKQVLKEGKEEADLIAKFTELQETKVAIEHYPFKESDFDFKSEYFYELINDLTEEKGEN